MLAAKYVARLQRANGVGRPIGWVQTLGRHTALLGLGPEWAGVALWSLLWNPWLKSYQPGQVGRRRLLCAVGSLRWVDFDTGSRAVWS